MKIDLKATDFINVNEVQIPDAFYRRFKVGEDTVDMMFGGHGFLPGSTFTIAGGHGSGKSTLMMQICEMVGKLGKKVAYISGEESIVQISYNSKRLGVQNVLVSNLKDVDDICEKIVKHKFDFVVIDSFPTIQTSIKMNSKKKEEYIVERLCSTAKNNDIIIGIIQHVTKTGDYKGSTVLPHSVDITIKMERDKDGEDLNMRDVVTTKNRFGSTSFVTITMTEKGFSFVKEKKETYDPLKEVKEVTMQEAIKIYGSYYNASQALQSKGFKKTGRGIYKKEVSHAN